ncbi:hypothetical protein PFISCL1PPCAC_27576, partial [Pristionchus fissidentatus]
FATMKTLELFLYAFIVGFSLRIISLNYAEKSKRLEYVAESSGVTGPDGISSEGFESSEEKKENT